MVSSSPRLAAACGLAASWASCGLAPCWSASWPVVGCASCGLVPASAGEALAPGEAGRVVPCATASVGEVVTAGISRVLACSRSALLSAPLMTSVSWRTSSGPSSSAPGRMRRWKALRRRLASRRCLRAREARQEEARTRAASMGSSLTGAAASSGSGRICGTGPPPPGEDRWASSSASRATFSGVGSAETCTVSTSTRVRGRA